MMADHGPAEQSVDGIKGSAEGRSTRTVCAALFITVLDGFDAFSLSLAGPRIAEDLGVPTAALGGIFASAMGGMIIGAFGGGALADKFGRLRVMLLSLAVFGGAALLMPWVTTGTGLMINRAAAGVGLGAAAPIAVALLNRASSKPPSDLMIAIVWAGIAAGGIVAALYDYLLIPSLGWRSIFIAGGILPIPAGILAYAVFHRHEARSGSSPTERRTRISRLLSRSRAAETTITAVMFLFGYVNSSVVVNWLPTILDHSGASPSMISAAFGAVNVGAVVGMVGLAVLSSRLQSAWTLVFAWGCAGALALVASLPGITAAVMALLAIGSYTVAAGAQALSVAFANRLHRDVGLESSTVGLMVSAGRIGQFAGLSVSGLLLAVNMPERGVFAMAGICACVAAGIALLASTAHRRGHAVRSSELSAPVRHADVPRS